MGMSLIREERGPQGLVYVEVCRVYGEIGITALETRFRGVPPANPDRADTMPFSTFVSRRWLRLHWGGQESLHRILFICVETHIVF